ncbi:MAG TPA: protein kinase [Bryobacteraceae bacterium]|nr:protein kinase [Bryobacteraceae bacterium]
MPLEPGAIVGDYRVLGILGEGGMGQVYKVQNLLSNRTEAMKILLPDLSVQPQQLERFLREIQVQASLVHPNIAGLHTASRQDNRLLMFMELVDGETLAARLADGPLPVEQTVNIATQLLNALAYAHERGVVHRDIKPSNIMLTTGGVAKLLDFGLAAARGDKRLTMTGNVLGSLHYMSPEQVRGVSPTPASDIYSLGLTVYEMLTGRRGIEGPSDYAVMTAHLQSMPEPPGAINPAVPEPLSQIVLQAVAKAPSDRFASALEFKAALDRYRQAPAAVTPAPPRVEPVAVPVRPAWDLSPVPAQTPAPPSPAPLVQPIPNLSPPAPMQTFVQPSSEHAAPAPMPPVRRPSLALIGTAAGVAVLLIGGGLVYWSRGAHESAAPVTATQPVVQAPAQPPPSKPVAAQPTPSQPAASQPAPRPPAVQVESRPPQQKPAEKRPPVQTEAKNVAPATPSTPPADTSSATPPPATAQPAVTPSPPPVKTAQQQQAEEWARVSSSRDPARLRQFLAAHPDGPFAGEASALLADITWEALRGSADARALREFATRYPASKYAPEALDKSEQIEAQQAVLDVLSRFQEAVSARDLDRVRGLWPRANAETVSRISDLFKQSRSVTLTLRPQGGMRLESDVLRPGARATWDRAEVNCQERLTATEGSKPRTTDATARIRLIKSGGAWIIESIATTPPSLYNPF